MDDHPRTLECGTELGLQAISLAVGHGKDPAHRRLAGEKLATGALGMNVAGAFIIYALQSAFGVLAGAYLMRQETRPT